MITRKGFIASIGAALTGAASKALSKAPEGGPGQWPLRSDVPPPLTPPLPQWYSSPSSIHKVREYIDPFAALNKRTRETIDLLESRRHARKHSVTWSHPSLCTPEDFKKRWALLKGYKAETRMIGDAPKGWWKASPGDYSPRGNVPKNIQDYLEEKKQDATLKKELQEFAAQLKGLGETYLGGNWSKTESKQIHSNVTWIAEQNND